MPGKYALVIGNTEYSDPGLAQLNAPGKDVEDLARALKSSEIAAFDDVITLVNESMSKVSEAIDDFFALKKPDDLLVLYFSGHGVRDEFGSLYLAIKNTNRARLRSTAIKADYVREAMDQSRSKRQVLILDCCNSGAFAHGTKAETGGAMGTASAFEGTGYGRVVLTATDATQFAWEGDQVIGESTNSLFTHFLVKGLEGEADYDGDGKITVDELYDYAYEQIVSLTPKQTPGKWSYKQQGDIILREHTRIQDIKSIPLPSDLIAATENSIPFVREGAIKQLESLLKGKNLGLARSAKEALERIAKQDDSRRIALLALQVLESVQQVESEVKAQGEAGEIEARKAKEESDRLAAQRAEQERLVREKAELDRKAQEEADRMAVRKAEQERLVRQKAEAEKMAREKAEAERIAEKKAERVERDPRTLAPMKTGALFLGGLLVLGVVCLTFAGLLGQAALFPTKATPTPTATLKAFASVTPPPVTFTTAPPTRIPVTPTSAFTAAPAPGEVKTSQIDGMKLHYVPAGNFLMGYNDETTYVEAFWIDETEVTNKMFALCLKAKKCQSPTNKKSYSLASYYDNPKYADYPVIFVSWNHAKAYCAWAGRALPSDAQWEKAARGPNGRIFPWGNAAPNKDLLNYNSNSRDTTRVGLYPNGKSPYGAYDMAGNVWEWVDNWFDSEQIYRALRGGSWYEKDNDNFPFSATRALDLPDAGRYHQGFRCALSSP